MKLLEKIIWMKSTTDYLLEPTNSRWQPWLINIIQHKNGCNSGSFSDIELKFSVVVVESPPQLIL